MICAQEASSINPLILLRAPSQFLPYYPCLPFTGWEHSLPFWASSQHTVNRRSSVLLYLVFSWLRRLFIWSLCQEIIEGINLFLVLTLWSFPDLVCHAVNWSFRLDFVSNSGVPTGMVQVGSFFPLEWTVLVITLVDEYMSPTIWERKVPEPHPTVGTDALGVLSSPLQINLRIRRVC